MSCACLALYKVHDVLYLTGITLQREVVISRVGFLHKTQTMDISIARAHAKFGEKLFDILKKSLM